MGTEGKGCGRTEPRFPTCKPRLRVIVPDTETEGGDHAFYLDHTEFEIPWSYELDLGRNCMSGNQGKNDSQERDTVTI